MKALHRYYRLRLFHVEEGQILNVENERGQMVQVRGRVDVSPDDPLQQVLDALPGGVVGGTLFAEQEAFVDEKSYPKALPVLNRLFEDNP